MSQFEFLGVLISILIALAISEILSGWGQLIRLRERVRRPGLHTGWTILVLLILVQGWWGFWQFQTISVWNFFNYVLLLSPYLILTLVAFVITPHTFDEVIDLEIIFFRHKRWFFVLGIAALVQYVAVHAFVLHHPLVSIRNSIRLSAMILLSILAFTDMKRVHVGSLLLAYILLLLFLIVSTPFLD